MDLQTEATAWAVAVMGELQLVTGKLGSDKMDNKARSPPSVTNSRQWSSVELLLSIASKNFIVFKV